MQNYGVTNRNVMIISGVVNYYISPDYMAGESASGQDEVKAVF